MAGIKKFARRQSPIFAALPDTLYEHHTNLLMSSWLNFRRRIIGEEKNLVAAMADQISLHKAVALISLITICLLTHFHEMTSPFQ